MKNSAQPTALDVLAGIPEFAKLADATLEALAQVAVQQRFEADQIVFLEGEPSEGLYLVQEGWLKAVRLSPAGREQVLCFLGAGEVVNLTSVLAGSPNPVTLIALEPTILWLIPHTALNRLLDAYPDLARAIIHHLAARVHHLVALAEDLSLRPVEARIARFLLEEAQEGVFQRPRWATQAELAARLGTVPDVLNRALRNMVEQGLIQVERRVIRIMDEEQLSAKIEE